MTNRERWLVGGVCFLLFFGSLADWYRKSKPGGAAEGAAEVAVQPDSESLPEMTTVDVGRGDPEPSPIDLNQAGADDLLQLPGIGPSKAAAILEWRLNHGPLRSADDLLGVRGIGPKTLERLRPLVTVTAPE